MIITVAVQSIIVICSLEIAGIHWKANRIRYISVLASLLVAITASVSFSYFQFYEISEKENLHIDRLNQVRKDVNDYLNKILAVKTEILEQQRAQLEVASQGSLASLFRHASADCRRVQKSGRRGAVLETLQ